MTKIHFATITALLLVAPGMLVIFASRSEVAAGSGSLLTGCTVNSSNQPSCAVPGEWTLAAAEGFEGALRGSESLNFGVSVSTVRAHTGNHSMQETINATSGHHESPGGWWSLNGVTGVHHVYMSWWSYLDPTAKVNAESFFGWIQKDTGSINEEEALIMDTEGPNNVLATSASLWFSPQTNDPVNDCLNTGKAKNCGKYGGSWNLNLGTWEQEELWIHPGTCNGGVPNNDGFIRFYINGQLRFHLDRTQTFDPSPEGSGNSGGNPNGCVDMSSPTINVGGVWTYLDVANPTTFHKYIDDIIVLKR